MKELKSIFIVVLMLLAGCLTSCNPDPPDYTNLQPDRESGGSALQKPRVPLADPFILYYSERYYAYGTYADEGISYFTSNDLREWTRGPRVALHKNDSWGDKWFWAPEVYHVNGKFYMYYSAQEHICVAVADSPEGPFKQVERTPMLPNEKAIDNTLFIDDDGTPYLLFVRFNDGLNIWVAELEEDLLTINMATMHKCINVSQTWERDWGRVNEGPFVIKHKGIYYMTYSANSYESHNYGIGCATATNINGPWTKYSHNPLLQKPKGLVGAGHHCIFKDKDGNLKLAFHAHNNADEIQPRHMYITDVGFKETDGADELYINPKYFTPRIK